MPKEKILILEEISVPTRKKRFDKDLTGEFEFLYTSNVEEAQTFREKEKPEIMFLSFNSGDVNSWFSFVDSLPHNPLPVPIVIIHSSKPIPAKILGKALKSRGYTGVYSCPYPSMLAEGIVNIARFATRAFRGYNSLYLREKNHDGKV